jgi:DME family drug/metabolite transporter
VNRRASLASVITILLSGTLLGTAGTAVALAPDDASVTSLGIARVAIGGLALIAIAPLFGGNRRRILALVRRPGVWVMALSTAGFQPLFFGATSRTGVALSTVLTIGTMPLFTGLISRIFLKEKLNRTWLLATSLAITGLVIRSWDQMETIDLLGVAMAITAGLCTGFYVNGAKFELNRGGHSVELPAAAYTLSALLLLPSLIGNDLTWVKSGNGILSALYLGLVSMALANTLQVVGLKRLSPGPTATLLLADPLTATLLGVLLLGEALTPLAIFGLVLVGSALIWQGVSQSRATEWPEAQKI